MTLNCSLKSGMTRLRGKIRSSRFRFVLHSTTIDRNGDARWFKSNRHRRHDYKIYCRNNKSGKINYSSTHILRYKDTSFYLFLYLRTRFSSPAKRKKRNLRILRRIKQKREKTFTISHIRELHVYHTVTRKERSSHEKWNESKIYLNMGHRECIKSSFGRSTDMQTRVTRERYRRASE